MAEDSEGAIDAMWLSRAIIEPGPRFDPSKRELHCVELRFCSWNTVA